MNFEEFKTEVSEHIKDYLPTSYENAEVSIRDVIKNNDTHLSGLTIREEGEMIAPTLYLEDFFHEYESGHSIDFVMDHIAGIYDSAKNNDIGLEADDLVSNITDYETTKDKIIPRVVNKEFNEERLQNMPHTDLGDLAVTYHVDLGKAEDGNMSVAVSNEMMEKYGVSLEEIHEKACENMEKLTPASFETIVETLAHLMIPGYEDMSEEEKASARNDFDMPDPGMYVLTNESKAFGAAVMLDSDTMDRIEKEVGEFYILPSSVHEVLIVPMREGMELSELEAMVQEVNATQVAPNEVLSDHVYKYDSKTKEIYRADKESERNKEKETEKRPSLKARLEDKKKEVKERDSEKEAKTKIHSKERE